MKRMLVVVVVFSLFSLFFIDHNAGAEDESNTAESAESAPKPSIPEMITISILEKLYDSVEFTHGNHVNYADSCKVCHHHSEIGKGDIVYYPCSECHSSAPVVGVSDKTSIGLKGAFHQQCMGCHKEMGSGPIGCTDCHARKKIAKEKTKEGQDKEGSGEKRSEQEQ